MSTLDDLPTNWGRWGLDDERGTLNFITPEARLRGVTEARTGETVSLAFPITPVVLGGGRPGPPTMTPTPAAISQVLAYTGSPASVDILTINTHHATMTHIDALGHIAPNGMIYPGVAFAEVAMGGTLRQGSTTAFIDGIVTRGVLLDLAPGGRIDDGHEVTREDLENAEQRAGVRVESGDALVIRGGWNLATDFSMTLPFLSLDAVLWMGEREISVLASDIGDKPPMGGAVMALHAFALPRLGLPLIDNANVTALAETAANLSRYSFLFTVGAIPVRGATGIPVNPLAVF
ncbi:cyclase family protein [Subtercola lobariae]|uniref:Cyclase n=1 Tax=Subtercola lobariae TaxID=1588641 RepID=A0A917B484_9MICO|nr:cyclase family protein [Subtercola lobariae]GGF17565.1 cyclase [Subtercola lobariae]